MLLPSKQTLCCRDTLHSNVKWTLTFNQLKPDNFNVTWSNSLGYFSTNRSLHIWFSLMCASLECVWKCLLTMWVSLNLSPQSVVQSPDYSGVIMSSPAGIQYSQADFLARWMPTSTRAGVILNPSPDLAGSLRHTSVVISPSLEPDDSFVSDFAPLPASADSSCLGVEGFARLTGGERAGTDRPVDGLTSVPPRDSEGELDSLNEMASKSQDLPLKMKLEQVKTSLRFTIWMSKLTLQRIKYLRHLVMSDENRQLLPCSLMGWTCVWQQLSFNTLTNQSKWKTAYNNMHVLPKSWEILSWLTFGLLFYDALIMWICLPLSADITASCLLNTLHFHHTHTLCLSPPLLVF